MLVPILISFAFTTLLIKEKKKPFKINYKNLWKL